MPYNKPALGEQLKISEGLPVGWPWRLLIFAAIILGAIVFLYFGIILGYKPYLNSRAKSLDKEVANLTESVGGKQQENLISFYSQLVNAKKLLANHPNASKLFNFLEKNTHPQINYLSLDLSLAERSLKLDGSVSNYEILVQQMESFRRAPEIERVFLEESKIGETGIRFLIRLVFKSELTK